jgi:hypothetical protein
MSDIARRCCTLKPHVSHVLDTVSKDIPKSGGIQHFRFSSEIVVYNGRGMSIFESSTSSFQIFSSSFVNSAVVALELREESFDNKELARLDREVRLDLNELPEESRNAL